MNNEASKIANQLKRFEALVPVMVNDMGQLALNHFTKSFRDQGFTDEVLEPWQPRRDDSAKSRGRAILVKTGRLRRSLRKVRRGQYSVSIVSDVPYAKLHNDGLRGGRGLGFQMPKRQFVGDSKKLNESIKKKINQRIIASFR